MAFTADISYTRVGAGEPLVLLHGIGHRWQAWTPVIGQLAEHFDVVALDLPGFGESAPLPAGTPYILESTLMKLLAFFGAIGLERPHLAGNSLGGALALELADRDDARSACAIAPAGFWTPRQRSYAISVLQMHYRVTRLPLATLSRIAASPALRAQAGRFIYAHPERLSPADFLGDALAMRNAAGLLPTLASGDGYLCRARPTVSTTLVWGTRDRILPFKESSIARERLPDAEFRPLVGSGHVAMSDDPQGVVDAIVDTAKR